MTVYETAIQLMTLFSPEEREIPDCPTYPGRNGAVILAMNGALQEIFAEGSPWVRVEDRGALLNAPATEVSIAVTHGSTSATISAETWQDWFSGCAIQIAGASVENRIRNDERTVTLKFPHDGTTGTATATVYHDALNLDSDVMAVIGRVKFGVSEIFPVADVTAGLAFRTDDFGFHRESSHFGFMGSANATYRVENWLPDEATAPAIRLLFGTAPEIAGMLEYTVRVVPMVITELASNDTLPIPLQFVQTVFFPIARQRLTGCAFYRGGGAADEIARAYQEALRTLAKINPAPNTGIRMIPRY